MNKNQANDTGALKTNELSLNKAKHFEILSINKEINDSSAKEYFKCKSWALNSKQIKYIIKKFVAMTSEEQYLSYSFYKCRISGEIKIDSIKYSYWLGAGGTLTLKNNSSVLYFGCSAKDCKKYFISGKLEENEFD